MDGVRSHTVLPLLPISPEFTLHPMGARADAGDLQIIIIKRSSAFFSARPSPNRDVSALKDVEGARMRRPYTHLALRYGILWKERRYTRWTF